MNLVPINYVQLFILFTQIVAMISMIYWARRDYYSKWYFISMCWAIGGSIPNLLIAAATTDA